MRLTAYSIESTGGVWAYWENIEAWRLEGSKLIIRQREMGRSVLKTVHLPEHVIGLADDAPAVARASSESAQYRPDPAKARREYGETRPAARLHIPDREPPRVRFGDSSRRRQFRGDGS